jgi:predicted enzyme related to lactoylglutathione lyase
VGRDALMSQVEQDRRIDYVEFRTTNMSETKRFYSGVFGWQFTDYGPDYTSQEVLFRGLRLAVH